MPAVPASLRSGMMRPWSYPPNEAIGLPRMPRPSMPESQGKRLLEACGLEWDASLLEFYRQEGVVKTASIGQVRQPIYRSSRMRWKNYAPHLTALAHDLAEYLQDDREELAGLGIEIPRVSGGGWIRRLTG